MAIMVKWKRVCHCCWCCSTSPYYKETSKSQAPVQSSCPERPPNCRDRFVDSKVFLPGMSTWCRSLILSPENFSLPFEMLTITTKDHVRIAAYLILQTEQPYQQLPTILLFHGNGGNIGDCLPVAAKFFETLNCNVLLVEYRGFGLSEGIPSEQGVYADAEAALEYALNRSDLDSTKIILYGLSLGGAVVIHVATHSPLKDRIAAVIVENTFASLNELLIQQFPRWTSPLLRFLQIPTKFTSAAKIGQLEVPTLIIVGMKDAFINPMHATKLYVLCGATRKQILRIPEGEHLNTWNAPEYPEGVQEFISQNVLRKPNALESDLELESLESYRYEQILLST